MIGENDKSDSNSSYKLKANKKNLTPLIPNTNNTQENPPVKFGEGSLEIQINNTPYSIKSFDSNDEKITADDINRFKNLSITSGNNEPSIRNMFSNSSSSRNSSQNSSKISIPNFNLDITPNSNSKASIGSQSSKNGMFMPPLGSNLSKTITSTSSQSNKALFLPDSTKSPNPSRLNKSPLHIERDKSPIQQQSPMVGHSSRGIPGGKALTQTHVKQKDTNPRASEWDDRECKDLLDGTLNKKGCLDLKPSNLKRIGSLGHGAQGHVEKMLHLPSGTMIALKSINLNTDETFLKALKLELDTLRGCECDYIVKCFGAFYRQSQIAIALEFMNMGSLSDIIKEIGSIPEIILGYITYQVLKGLEYLHKTMRVIHRDIKPSNLLINSKGQVKIADFGVSGKIEYTLQYKKTWVGTVTYMSPERFQGENYLFDTDLWSLGLSVVECALGNYPYPYNEKVNYFDLMDYIITKPSPTLPDTYSADLKDFVSICLRKEAGTRLSASELLKHPFVKNYANIDSSIFIQWLENVYE